MIRFADQEYEIVYLHENDPRPAGMGETDEGFTDFDHGRIYVHLAASPTRVRATRNHEYVHAALDASCVEHYLRELAAEAERDPDQVIEDVVRFLAPALSEVLK